jgi:DNA-binding CsgD family transcriptional regulator
MHITKREFEVISLYSRGLTFKEMGFCLNIATRTAINYYMRVKAKDKSRITRAKKSRAINKQSYIIQLQEVVKDARKYNREIRRYGYTFRNELSIKNQSKIFRLNYFHECLLFAFKSYCKFRLKSAIVSGKKVNT